MWGVKLFSLFRITSVTPLSSEHTVNGGLYRQRNYRIFCIVVCCVSSTHTSIHQFIHSRILPSIHKFTHSFILSSVHQFKYSSIHRVVDLSIIPLNQSVHLHVHNTPAVAWRFNVFLLDRILLETSVTLTR